MLPEPVVVIRGVVSMLRVSSDEESFVLGGTEEAAGGVAAVGLAASGLAGAATGAALSVSDTAERVETFTCRVGGTTVGGRFGKVGFADGDAVEVLASTGKGTALAYAVMRPSDRTIWMYPHCGRGSTSYRNYCIRTVGGISLLMSTVFVGAFAADAWYEGHPFELWFFALLFTVLAGLMALIFGIVASRFVQFARLSDAIFSGLGFDQPDRVDLHRRLREEMRQQPAQEREKYHPFARWVYKY